MSSISLSVEGEFTAPLSQAIQKEYNKLLKLVAKIPEKDRHAKLMDGNNNFGKISVNDIIAYQIGWGNLVIGWYQAGIRNQMPEMPGEGFATWDYEGLAHLFYRKYQYKNFDDQAKQFFRVVKQIIDIVEKEFATGNLDKEGVWSWCTLSSGSQWPLSKWITINTAAPYKSGAALIKKTFKNK